MSDNSDTEDSSEVQKKSLINNMTNVVLIKKYTSFLDTAYKDILLRTIDLGGLITYLPKLMSNELTEDEVIKIISESEEARNIKNFSHYSDKYWNNLDVVKGYLNRLSTGNEKVSWIEDLKVRFKQYLPFQKVLIVGCGNGWLERQLYDLQIGTGFDAFDVSEKYLEIAKKEKKDRPINYFVSDINNMKNITDLTYDAVFNFAILHHATLVDYAMEKLARTLKPTGFMFNWEYVGPARNQYTDQHVKKMEKIMSRLPQRFQSKHRLRPPIENFRVEPTEAIHSDLIIPAFRKYFDSAYERNLNGGIAYQILWNNVDQFMNKTDKEAEQVLRMILEEDERLSYENEVPILFWYGIGKPKNNN